jgi:hypothetical protein
MAMISLKGVYFIWAGNKFTIYWCFNQIGWSIWCDAWLASVCNNGQKDKLNIQDRELLIRFEQLHTMTEKEKELAKEVLDLVIPQHKFNELVGPSAAA